MDSPNTAWPRGYVPTTQKLKKRTFGIARMDMAVFDRELAEASEDAEEAEATANTADTSNAASQP